MEQRDTNGRFIKGNPGGPGRPKRAVEADYLAVITSAVSLEDWHKVVIRAVTDARKGDARARDWLSRYLVGEGPSIELTQLSAGQVVLHCPDNGRALSHASLDGQSER